MQRCSWLCEINTSHRQTRLCKCPPYSTPMDAISSNCNAAFAVAPLTARDKTRILRRDLSSRSFHIGRARSRPLDRSYGMSQQPTALWTDADGLAKRGREGSRGRPHHHRLLSRPASTRADPSRSSALPWSTGLPTTFGRFCHGSLKCSCVKKHLSNLIFSE